MVNETMRSTRFAFVGCCALLFLALAKPAWCSEPKTSSSITPDAKIQATIRVVVTAKGEDDKEAQVAMKMLDDIARRRPKVLAPQIIYYSLHVTNEREGWKILGVMKRLASQWDSEMRKGLIPLLESNDEKTRKQVFGWLAGIDGFGPPRPEINVLFYRETLMEQKKAPPPGLVNYFFNFAPSKAFLLFGEIYSEEKQIPLTWPRPLMWSDHVITTVKWRLLNRFLQEGDLEKAQKELDTLSKHEGWYARRYVVEVMRDIPKLGTPEIAERLKKDPNPLVAEPAKLIK